MPPGHSCAVVAGIATANSLTSRSTSRTIGPRGNRLFGLSRANCEKGPFAMSRGADNRTMTRIFAITAALIVTGASLTWAQTPHRSRWPRLPRPKRRAGKRSRRSRRRSLPTAALSRTSLGAPPSRPRRRHLTPARQMPRRLMRLLRSRSPARPRIRRTGPAASRRRGSSSSARRSSPIRCRPNQCVDDRLRQSRRPGATGEDRNRSPGGAGRARTGQEGNDDQTKAIAAIEDEARRAGVPVGWLRPGA